MTSTDRDIVDLLADQLNESAMRRAEAEMAVLNSGLGVELVSDIMDDAASTLRALLDRIGMLDADFDDCNSERARWKARAEQAEKVLTTSGIAEIAARNPSVMEYAALCIKRTNNIAA